MAFLPGLFGGDNQVGFFGGGRYRPDEANFQIPGMQDVTNENWQRGAEAQYQAGQSAQDQGAARAQQQQLAQNLFGQLSGNAPSVAQEQLKQTTQGNLANAYAMAQSGHANPGAARMAANNAAAVNQQAAGQGALLRAQEMQNTQGMLGGLLGGMRGQDQGMYGMGSQGAQNWMAQNQAYNLAQAQANQNKEQMNLQGFQGAQQNALGGKLLNAAAGVAGAMMPMLAPKAPAPATAAHGGLVSVMGERICPGCGNRNSECTCYARAQGGLIPGYAKGGDRNSNDTVPALLSPGEIVLPRSVTKDEDAPEKARLFVEAIRKSRMKKAA